MSKWQRFPAIARGHVSNSGEQKTDVYCKGVLDYVGAQRTSFAYEAIVDVPLVRFLVVIAKKRLQKMANGLSVL